MSDECTQFVGSYQIADPKSGPWINEQAKKGNKNKFITQNWATCFVTLLPTKT